MKNQILGIIYFSLLSKIDFCGKRFLDLLEDQESEGVHSYIKFQ